MNASIIIPSYNACERLYLNLASLNCQDCGQDDFEVIVIDNGSKDKTDIMLKDFKPRFKLTVISLKNNRSRAAARNAGIENSQGDILIFHDSDMIAYRDFVGRHMEEHGDSSTIVCGSSWKRIYSYYYRGFQSYLRSNFMDMRHRYALASDFSLLRDKYPLLSEGQIEDGSFLEYSFELESKEASQRWLLAQYGEELCGYNFPWRFFITNNCSALKEDIVKAGLFDENFREWGCEDLDLGYRLFMAGCKFKKKNDIVSVHQEHPVNFKENGVSNIHYFTDKYNTVDLLLFYYTEYTSIPSDWINELVNEVDILKQSEEYSWLIELYVHLLKTVRDRRRNIKENLTTAMCKSFEKAAEISEIYKKCLEANDKLSLNLFAPSFFILAEELYGVKSPQGLL